MKLSAMGAKILLAFRAAKKHYMKTTHYVFSPFVTKEETEEFINKIGKNNLLSSAETDKTKDIELESARMEDQKLIDKSKHRKKRHQRPYKFHP